MQPSGTLYRALLTDIDGTLAPYGVPPPAPVVAGLSAVAQQCHVSLISSRDFHYVAAMAARFSLKGPQVADGGARIFRRRHWRPSTASIWNRRMPARCWTP